MFWENNSKVTWHISIIQNVELTENEDLNVSVGLENDNFFKWNLVFEGPADSLYEVYSISLTLKIWT